MTNAEEARFNQITGCSGFERRALGPKIGHRSEVLANLKEPTKALFRIVDCDELAKLLAGEPRSHRATRGSNRRLSPNEIDQLTEDYRSGVGSTYVLAKMYGVHRSTIAAHLKGRGERVGRTPLQEEEAKRARDLSEQGLSLNAIGREMQRDPKTIKLALR